MTGDPYEEANEKAAEEAKLLPPDVPKKNRKLAVTALVLAGLILGLVILVNVASLITGRQKSDSQAVAKPRTMSSQQSSDFERQQASQANYMQGMDRDKHRASAEDTVLGNAAGEASDPYAETDGVPRKTPAQDAAEHGRSASGSEKSAAELAREKTVLEAQQRRENDLQSSAVSVDFSDYFDKQSKSPAPADPDNTEQQPSPKLQRTALQRELDEAAAGEPDNPEAPKEAVKKEAHDPKEDYAFDSSTGKLYRLMESSIIETVLVNRLTGASVGPVIVMVTTDVYSKAGRLLIPKGTRLLGHVSAVASSNQERLFVAFHRMIVPDGYSVSLDKFQGLDVVGQTGLRDLVNHHYVQIFGASLALAAVSATTQIGNSGGAYGTYDWGVSMRNGLSEGLGQSAQRVMERFLNVLPTFTIRERSRVKVMLAGDLLLPDIQNHTMDPDL